MLMRLVGLKCWGCLSIERGGLLLGWGFWLGGARHGGEQVGASRVSEVIRFEFVAGDESVDQGQAAFEGFAHRDRYGVVERNNGRGLDGREQVVEGGHLSPVGLA